MPWLANHAAAATKTLSFPLRYINVTRPSLFEFYTASSSMSDDPQEAIRSSVGPNETESISRLCTRFEGLQKELSERRRETRIRFPSYFGVTDTSAALLYLLVRLKRPRLVVETGVADGVSTFFILRGLRENGVGRLISFDISDDVGALLSPDEVDGWTLKKVSPQAGGQSAAGTISRLGKIDLFLHDSYHWYATQSSEFHAAWPNLSPTGTLLCDDADASYAFLDFARTVGVRPQVLFTERKVLGILPKERTVAAAGRLLCQPRGSKDPFR